MSTDALEAIDRLLGQGGDVDDALRTVVDVLAQEPEISWAGIRFLERGELVLGPSAGEPDEHRRRITPIVYQGTAVGELVVDGEVEQTLLDRVAILLSASVLLGWDTGGDRWEP